MRPFNLRPIPIVSPPVFTTAQTTTNYLFTAVTSSNDPTATNFDLDADGDTDFFLEFTMDFTDIVSSMNTVAGISIDETTQLSFILATANSDNSLNQDLNGADGGIGSALTWGELGVMSNPTSFRPVPEPASGLVVSLAMLSFVFRRRRVV